MSIWQIVKKSFRDFYNHIFLLGAVSLVWFFIVIPLTYVGIAGFLGKIIVPILMFMIFTGPLNLAAFSIANELVLEKKQIRFRDYFPLFAKNFYRGMFAHWLSAGIYILLIVDLFFFLTQDNQTLVLFSGIFIYLIAFFTICQIYFWGLLAQTDAKIFTCFKRSVLLALDNIVFSLGIFVAFMVLVLVGVLTAGIGLVMSFIGFLSVLSNNATRELLIKYEVIEEKTTPYESE